MVKPMHADSVAPAMSGQSEELLARAEKVFSKGMVDALREEGLDLVEAGGTGSFVQDVEGKEYLDCDAGTGMHNLGRRNEILMQELRAASLELDQGNFVMLSEEKAKLASRLAAFLPGDLHCALFTVVRGEPVDAACKLARGVTGRPKLISIEGAHHGDSGFAMTLSDRRDKGLFGPLVPETSSLPFGDIAEAKKAIGGDTAAVILEVVQAENGCLRLTDDYLRELRRLCDKAGAKLIIDETVTGFGRTGLRFAFERSGITPDTLILGEAITGGLFPMTALVFTPEQKAFFDSNPLIHLSTFGGHDVGCRVARKALEEYERIRPWEHARLRGAMLAERLRELRSRHSKLLQGVVEEGLMLSLRMRSEKIARELCLSLGRVGIVARRGKVATETVNLRPSLLISEQEMSRVVAGLDEALGEMTRS